MHWPPLQDTVTGAPLLELLEVLEVVPKPLEVLEVVPKPLEVLEVVLKPLELVAVVLKPLELLVDVPPEAPPSPVVPPAPIVLGAPPVPLSLPGASIVTFPPHAALASTRESVPKKRTEGFIRLREARILRNGHTEFHRMKWFRSAYKMAGAPDLSWAL
jgi:hypothetical protein